MKTSSTAVPSPWKAVFLHCTGEPVILRAEG